MATLLQSRQTSSAAAFLELDSNNKLIVRGKIYDDFGSHQGPSTQLDIPLPAELISETKTTAFALGQRRSDELIAFCKTCFEKAAEREDWFKNFLKL
ncbi:MAG: hypothetical protein J6039_04260 [Alphaproteobacteria bacterium]|jgi:hypothetical protein|nr:hypothetical protein [Alphaproteobacteria bacterium]